MPLQDSLLHTDQFNKMVNNTISHTPALQQLSAQLADPITLKHLFACYQQSMNLYQQCEQQYIAKKLQNLTQELDHQFVQQVKTLSTSEEVASFKAQKLPFRNDMYSWVQGSSRVTYYSRRSTTSESTGHNFVNQLKQKYIEHVQSEFSKQLQMDYVGFIQSEDPSLPILPLPSDILKFLPPKARCLLVLNCGKIKATYNLSDANQFTVNMSLVINKNLHPILQYTVPFNPRRYQGAEAVWWFWMGGEVPSSNNDNVTLSLNESHGGKRPTVYDTSGTIPRFPVQYKFGKYNPAINLKLSHSLPSAREQFSLENCTFVPMDDVFESYYKQTLQ